MSPSLTDVEAALHRIWIGEEKARLRKEDLKKARELTALLDEVSRLLPKSTKRAVTLIDAAAGKSYVGLLAAEFLLQDRSDAQVVTLERDQRRVSLSREAQELVRTKAQVDCRVGEVQDVSRWPTRATLAVALHACGKASDDVIESAISSEVRALLLVPCCTSIEARGLVRATQLAEQLGIPSAAPVRRRFLQSIVDAERTLRLEAAGYRVEVVEFVAPTVTPHNLLYRAVLTRDEGRAERARSELVKVLGGAEPRSDRTA
jgi:hypothetical protein